MTPPVLLGALLGAAVSPVIAAAAAAAARRPITWRRLWPAAAAMATTVGVVLAVAQVVVQLPVPVVIALAAAAGPVITAVLVDAIEHRLPNVFTVPLVAAGLPILTAVSWFTGWGSPLRAVLGLLLFGGWMLIVALTGAGAGDVKLAAGVGMWLAWVSWWAFAAGVAVALIGMAVTDLTNRHLRGRPQSPLGPAIGLGMLVGFAVTVVLV